MATTIGAAQRAENRETAISFFEDGMNINQMTQQDTYTYLYNRARNGGIESISNSSTANHIRNTGALAQSMHMLNNPPPHHIMRDLRSKVDSIQHEAGPTHTDYADMRVYG